MIINSKLTQLSYQIPDFSILCDYLSLLEIGEAVENMRQGETMQVIIPSTIISLTSTMADTLISKHFS